MDCQAVIDRLDELLEDRLGDDQRRAVEEHLRSCDRCAEMRDLLREAPVEPPAGLAAAVLERTTGSPCASAQRRLCDHVDGRLGAVDHELVDMHVAACAECNGLAQVLAQLRADLPLLAELEPDERFLSDVLDRTSGRLDWTARLTRGWKSLLQRPRIAWEGAYVGACLFAVVFALPNSPLAGVPEKAVVLVQARPDGGLRDSLAWFEERVTSPTQVALRTGGVRAARACRDAASGIDRSLTVASEETRDYLGTLSESLASGLETDETKDDKPTEGDRR